ncbi:MAG TPA: SIMPL domain-containing protein, partial [Candidatus Didemnitutus sp.]|nr:SIMPL domain-containing protein [Candidatus Didemnitutus sp.]
MNAPRPHLVGLLAGVFLSAGIAFSALTLANAWTRIGESQVVNVTGSARKNIRSDLVIWRANFSVEAPSLLEAQQKLQADFAKVSAFLQTRGLNEFAAQPVQIRELTARQHNEEDGTTANVRVGYALTQTIEVRSTEVDRVPKLASDTSELLREDVAFVSEVFDFIYTKAGDAKVEMMADATRDARARAEQIAAQGGRSIKQLRTAHMGVVQIN